MDITIALVAVPVILLLLALILEPIAQKRRERALWEQIKNLRDASDAQTAVSCAIQQHQQNAKLPEKWYHSYRFWLK